MYCDCVLFFFISNCFVVFIVATPDNYMLLLYSRWVLAELRRLKLPPLDANHEDCRCFLLADIDFVWLPLPPRTVVLILFLAWPLSLVKKS